MKYLEIIPGEQLRPYIRNFYVYESGDHTGFDDIVFPSGYVEVIFNLGEGKWQTAKGNHYATTPRIELWGQLLRPLPVRSLGKNIMLGARLYPHAAACLLHDKADQFNNHVVDFAGACGPEAESIRVQLIEAPAWSDRIKLVENFFIQRLSLSDAHIRKMSIVGEVMKQLSQEDFYDNIANLALRFGISSRYLQRLFVEYSGLTPKLYSKINRFQHSLKLVSNKESTFTDIAYECGYFDQSHFIREFKSFTGLTPSAYTSATPGGTFAEIGN